MSNKNIPLKWKLIAWWEGYDVIDIEKKMRQRQQKKTSNNNKKPPLKIETNQPDWDDVRMNITQQIWGDGFCGPGGPKNIIDMSKLLALSPQMSALMIGAGLGGPTRILAHEFGVWINGYESNRYLAEKAMQMSTDAGLERKAKIEQLNLDKNPLFTRQFDRAFSKETLFCIENKATLLQNIFDHLKEDTLFLMTDYVIKDKNSLTNPHVTDWLEHEPFQPYPATSDKMVKTMKKAGFNVRIHEDITNHYLVMINEAWASADKVVMLIAENEEARRENMKAMMVEAELWNRRTKALRSGELKLCRYLAHKPLDSSVT